MVASTLVCPPVEAVPVSALSPDSRFEAVRGFMVGALLEVDAPYEIIDPQVDMVERRWLSEEDPQLAVANRRVIVESITAAPDLLTARDAYCGVTGNEVDPVTLLTANNFQDAEKPSGLSAQSQTRPHWPEFLRIAMMEHVLLSQRAVETSTLPDYYRGNPFKKRVAVTVGEHHGRQPAPSLQYGCGNELDFPTRSLRDLVGQIDWFGAKFYRDNAGNRDDSGEPLSDLVRAQQFGACLLYYYEGPEGYWHVDERNNPWQIVLAIYSAMRRNHPQRLPEPELAFSGDMSILHQPRRPYIDVTKINFRDPSLSMQSLGIAA